MRTIILLAAILLTHTAVAQVYRWVDENGVVHYSDRPAEGAETVDLPEDSAVEFRRPVTLDSGDAAADEQEAPAASVYESFRVVQPSDEETLWNIGATLDVSLNLTPGLKEGHGIEVWFDGAKVESPDPTSLRFTIPEVYRGTHNLWARVTDSRGRVLIQSNEVTFYVQQTSVINPP